MVHLPATERRRIFVEATVPVISKFGVEGATTRRIAEEAGAPLASLHYVFGSKEELFLAVLEHVADESSVPVDAPAAPAGLTAAARAWLQYAMDWNIASGDLSRAAFELYFWAIRQHDRPGLAVRVYDLLIIHTTDFLRSALKPGDDESLVEPLARMLIAAADGILMQWFSHGDEKRRDVDLDLILAMVDSYLGV